MWKAVLLLRWATFAAVGRSVAAGVPAVESILTANQLGAVLGRRASKDEGLKRKVRKEHKKQRKKRKKQRREHGEVIMSDSDNEESAQGRDVSVSFDGQALTVPASELPAVLSDLVFNVCTQWGLMTFEQDA